MNIGSPFEMRTKPYVIAGAMAAAVASLDEPGDSPEVLAESEPPGSGSGVWPGVVLAIVVVGGLIFGLLRKKTA